MKIKSWYTAFLFAGLLLTLLANCKEEVATEDEIPVPPSNGEVYDVDGNKYSTVVIGTQEWFTSNLKTTKLRDGTVIPLVEDKNWITWPKLVTPAYCWLHNRPDLTYSFGILYNWYTVRTDILCPTGWHVPWDAEWTTLANFVGGINFAGEKLKEKGSYLWGGIGSGATNSYGFTALPGGTRYSSGQFVSDDGHWWSSSEYASNTAWARSIGFSYTDLRRRNLNQRDGLNVRCLRD